MRPDAEERRRNRILRWGQRQGIVGMDRIGPIVFIVYKDGHEEEHDYTELIAQGLVNAADLTLTDAGELECHQLAIREWMAKHSRHPNTGEQTNGETNPDEPRRERVSRPR